MKKNVNAKKLIKKIHQFDELLNNSSKFIFLLIVLADFNQIETGPLKSADNWFNS